MPKVIFLVFSLLFLSLFLRGQSFRQYSFTHYNTASGLISNQVNTTVQDEDGYIWIGSQNGLQRYDGMRYKNFRHQEGNSSTIPSNLILQLLIDNKKNLWILTVDGKAGKFDTRTFTYTSAVIKANDQAWLSSTLQMKILIKDETGHLFLLLHGNEIMTYDEKKNEFSSQNNFFKLKPGGVIADFAPQPGTRKYWSCNDKGGFSIYNDISKKISYPGSSNENETFLEKTKDITGTSNLYFDKHDRFWFTNVHNRTPRIFCYDFKKRDFILYDYQFDEKVLDFHEIFQIFEQQDSTVWISGRKILARFLEKENQFELVHNGYGDEHSISFRIITQLTEDREHNIWVGTANNGVYRFNPAEQYFSNIKHTNYATGKSGDGSPLSFMHDKDSTILSGIWGDGLYRYNRDMKEIPLNIKGIPDINSAAIWDMCYSRDSSVIWMTPQQGLYKYDVNKRVASYYSSETLKDLIREVKEDRNNNLWLGTRNTGVFKWNITKGKDNFDNGLSAFTGIPRARITKITIDTKGYVWIGTFSNGAYVIDPKTEKIVMHFDTASTGEMKLPEQNISGVLEYSDSLMIISTSTDIFVYNRLLKKKTLITASETIAGLISSMEKDDEGHIWVSTTAGLYRITMSSRVFIQFSLADGLNSDYFVSSASHVLPDGRMLFGTSSLIVAFYPPAIRLNNVFPHIRITDFKVKDRLLRVDSLLKLKRIELGPDENSLTIDFSTLSYNTAYVLRYKLEGLDKDWEYADHNYQLIYSYLPPGNYTLIVNTLDSEGNASNESFQLFIHINPPLWKTWWFYCLLALLMGGLLFWLDRQRMKRKETLQKMRSNIAGNLHEEVNTALNNINILSEMANLKADKDIERSKEYIQQIHNKSKHMIIAMDDMLWSIDPQNDNMEKTVERMTEYISLLNNRHDVDIAILVDEKVKKLKLDMQLRHDALLLFKESITDQVQCGAREINIHIGYEKSYLIYTVQFNAESCNIEKLNNLFYSQKMDKRLKGINALLNIEISKSNAIVILKVPVG